MLPLRHHPSLTSFYGSHFLHHAPPQQLDAFQSPDSTHVPIPPSAASRSPPARPSSLPFPPVTALALYDSILTPQQFAAFAIACFPYAAPLTAVAEALTQKKPPTAPEPPPMAPNFGPMPDFEGSTQPPSLGLAGQTAPGVPPV